MQGEPKETNLTLPPGFSDAPALEGHLQHWADLRPEAPALYDPSNRKAAGLGTLRRLDYWSLNKIVSRVASVFSEQGLNPGDIIAIQLANTVECPITVLAAMRAGLVPCLIPLLWRRHELEAVFQKLPVKAIICQGDHLDHSYSEMMCEIAASNLSVRFVYGAGSGLPDGVMPLNEVFERPAGRDLGQSYTRNFDPAPNDPAVILWGTNPEGKPSPLWRTHQELINAGMAHVIEAQISSADRILNPFPLSCATGLIALFVPWLLSGAAMVQHEPFEEAAYLKDLSNNEITYAALPSAVFQKHYESGTLRAAAPSLTRASCVWSPRKDIASRENIAAMLDPSLPVFDILNIGEFASIMIPRSETRPPNAIPLGPIHTPYGEIDSTLILETRLKGSVQKAGEMAASMTGQLLIRGLLVPDIAYALWNGAPKYRDGADGWLNTGIYASISEGRMETVRCEADPRFIYHGGLVLPADDLDAIYADYANFNDAAAFTIEDPLMGERIFAAVVPIPGQSPSMSEFRDYLSARSVAPYKIPEKLVVVSLIPRDDQGRVVRNHILNQI